MPNLALHPCLGMCGRLLPSGTPYCAVCGRTKELRRGKTAERGYDSAHRRLRLAVLAEFPICQLRLVCQGTVATDLDHIIPISRRPDLRLVRSNVQSSCQPCNVAKRDRVL